MNTCGGCHFWRTQLYSEGARPKEGEDTALCTARDSIFHKMLAWRYWKGCPFWYDYSIQLTSLQREGMEQGFTPGTSPLEVLAAEHPEKEEGVRYSFRHASARMEELKARIRSRLEVR